MFQGDTSSPVIFPIVFNPQSSSQFIIRSFCLKAPNPNSIGLLPVNSAISMFTGIKSQMNQLDGTMQ